MARKTNNIIPTEIKYPETEATPEMVQTFDGLPYFNVEFKTSENGEFFEFYNENGVLLNLPAHTGTQMLESLFYHTQDYKLLTQPNYTAQSLYEEYTYKYFLTLISIQSPFQPVIEVEEITEPTNE